ncbi:MAG: MoaD/ThiS family protein [Cyanobacteriota bacterium]|nr:MoaD/ThiS family protein [Cyanobacteriota bacterium]
MATPTGPEIRILLFAGLREQAGWAERLWPAANAGDLTPRRLWQHLQLPWPLDARVRVAINQQFADPDTPLQPGDELAFLPPISGG